VKDNFENSLKLVLKHEGGWFDHPKDPGGATMKGIIISVYSKFKGRPVTKDELRNITDEEVRTIYRNNYWSPMKCDELPVGIDYIVFDAAVNTGLRQATLFTQRAAGVKDDGQFGPVTLKATKEADPLTFINSFSSFKERFYRSLKTFEFFGRGWLNRTADVKKHALAMLK
jgi:lysozyme family protein